MATIAQRIADVIEITESYPGLPDNPTPADFHMANAIDWMKGYAQELARNGPYLRRCRMLEMVLWNLGKMGEEADTLKWCTTHGGYSCGFAEKTCRAK